MQNVNEQKLNSRLDDFKVEKKFDQESTTNIISLSELMKKEFEETGWLVEKLVPVGGIVAISAPPASFKTWLILHIASQVAKPESVLFGQFEIQQGAVLFIDEENGDRLLQQRMRKISPDYDLPIHFLPLSGFKLNEGGKKMLLKIVQEKNIKLILIDALVRVHTADENSAGEMAKVFEMMRQITKIGVSVIFTHHHRKPKNGSHLASSHDMRGSSDILAAVDCHISVERKDNHLILTQTKLRQDKELPAFKVKILKEGETIGFEYEGECEVENMKVTKNDITKQTIIKVLSVNNNLSKTKLHEEVQKEGVCIVRGTLNSAIKKLVEDGRITESEGAGHSTICSLVSSATEILPFE